MYAFAQPALHVLVDGVESVPAARRITGGIAVLAHGAGADFHPGLQRLDALIEITDYFGDIVPPPLREVASVSVFLIGIAVGEAQGMLGVAQVIEMYAIHIVTFHDFTDEAHQVFFGLRVSGIEKVFAFVRYADSRFAFGDRLLAESGDMLAVAQRNGYHPGMAFHTAFMAFGYGEGKRVVTGVAADFPCQNGVIGFDCGFIEYVATGTGLKQYGVEVGGFQFVQYFYELGLLLADTFGSGGAGTGPVQSVNGGDPCGAYLMLGRALGGKGEKTKDI